jgi:lipopolysaccharide export system permease protein
MLIQIILTSIIVPSTQNHSRSIIRNSSVDFFESFVKPKKFNDNIRGLTIYADSKDENGNLKNIYLKKDSGDKKYQITVAKTGKFKTINGSKFLVLYNGQTINLINKKVTNFNFSKSDFTLSQLDSDVIIQDKIQETSTLKIIRCLRNYFKKDLSEIKDAPAYLSANCTKKNLDNIFQELYKRFVIPLYIPVLILTSLLLILNSKENLSYNKYKIFIFTSGLILIIFSESSLKFVQNNFYGNLKILIVPFFALILLYILFNIKLIHKVER